MKKINLLWLILNTIFLILFNTLFFVIGGTSHTSSVWISYTFIHFAYFMLLITPILVKKYENAAIFGYPLLSLSTGYFLIQFVVGLLFIFIALDGYKTTLTTQICIAGIYGIFLTIFMIANEYTGNSVNTRQTQISYIKGAATRILGILSNIKDPESVKKVEKVYDILSTCPVKTHTDVAPIENSIMVLIDKLEIAVSNDDKDEIVSISDSIIKSANERNMILKRIG